MSALCSSSDCFRKTKTRAPKPSQCQLRRPSVQTPAALFVPLCSPPSACLRVGKVAVVAGVKEVARTVLSVAGTIYDFLFDESFMWEVVHAAVVRLGLPAWLSMLILGSATASVAYYMAVVRRLAKVYFKARSKGARIATQMSSILAQPYSPTPWAFNRHLTTILGSEIRSMPALNIRRYAHKRTQFNMLGARSFTPNSNSPL